LTTAYSGTLQIVPSRRLKWIALTAALVFLLSLVSNAAYAACTSPVGAEGDIIYNDDFNVVQFCDNTSWISMSGTAGTTDARIGTLTASKWCAVNVGGTAIDCTQNAPAASAGTDKQLIFNDGGTTLAGAATLYWDKTTSRLSVNSGLSPTQAVDVTGKVTSSAVVLKSTTGAAAPISGSSYWSSNGTNVWRATGNVGIGATGPIRPLDISYANGAGGIAETGLRLANTSTFNSTGIQLTSRAFSDQVASYPAAAK
jgi:hypothetical protein